MKKKNIIKGINYDNLSTFLIKYNCDISINKWKTIKYHSNDILNKLKNIKIE